MHLKKAYFSLRFDLLSTLRQCLCPDNSCDCPFIVVLYYIPASKTEHVLAISVLWQLCIRPVRGMAFECEKIYPETLKRHYLLSLLFLILI